ncbi:hypothetical protein [Paracoccus benzoatiresistens]|uniref:Uncharacterized protein n=1 Tax=Paracoccus benzoatiresistens TaxID=2997341 RepID=A0ABT4JBE9_9RHOB|nr:hypothetical protein [Paracoccus sp. EF6]MCZ0964409.1 hypothetical protein [Paracoccus sp. EF6]
MAVLISQMKKAPDINKFFISSAVALILTSTHLAAGPIHTQDDTARLGTSFGEQIWLAKDNNGNGHGNDKARKNGHGNAGNGNRGNGKAHGDNEDAKADKGNDHAKGDGGPEHAGGPKLKTNGKGVEHASHGNGRGASGSRESV